MKLDYELHEENQELYDKLYQRGSKLIHQAVQKFYEKYPEPLSSKENLERHLDHYIRGKKNLVKSNMPEFVIDQYDEKIADVSRRLANSEYLQTKAEHEYKKEFDLKYAEWSSTVLKELEEEILEYNKKAYYDWKFSGFDETGFNEWKNSLDSVKLSILGV